MDTITSLIIGFSILVIIIFIITFIMVKIAINELRNTKNTNSEGINHLNNKEIEYSKLDYSFNSNNIIPLSDLRGRQGERIINDCLSKLILEDEYLLTNLLLPLKNGKKTEIDCVLISRKGVFCIEVKNWVGHIIGDEQCDYWIQKYNDLSIPDKKHRNPFKQNEKHCSKLEKELDYEYNVFNIVLFTNLEDRSQLYSPSTYDIDSFINYYKRLPDKLYEEDIESIVDCLVVFEASEEEINAHKKTFIN